MVIKSLCPVCGYIMADPPRDYNICPSCGTEFGIHDVNSSIADLREVWLENGPQWYSNAIPQPLDWSPFSQLANLEDSFVVRMNVYTIAADSTLKESPDWPDWASGLPQIDTAPALEPVLGSGH
jgi:hypothetical protein